MRILCSNPGLITCQQSSLGQVSSLSQASVSSQVKWRDLYYTTGITVSFIYELTGVSNLALNVAHSNHLINTSFLVGEGSGTPLQYTCLENPMDGGAWWAAVHGVARSRTRLTDFSFSFHFHALEKEMATHSSVLAWRIPGTGEPGGLPSLGSHRVGHD